MSGSPSWSRTRRRRGADLRLVPAAVGAWVAAAILIGAPGAATPAALIAWAISAAALLGALSRRREPIGGALAAVALAAGAVALAATGIAFRAESRAPPALEDLRGAVPVELVVTEEADVGTDRLRGIARHIAGIAGEMPVLAVGVRVESAIGIGSLVRLDARIAPTGPGGGIVALVIADGAPVVEIAPPPAWLDWGNAMRDGFRRIVGGLPGDGGALVTGLAIGDDRDLPESLERAMRTSSLTHLTAVSGANCAIVVGAVMVGGALLGIRRRWRIAVALAVLAAFVVLVTPQPSVVRAAVMAAAALLGLALARPMRGLPLLCGAVLAILVVDPWAARELGFILSASATAGLLVLSAPLARVLATALPYRLALALAVPLAAQLCCQPAIAVIDSTVPTYGVIANLLAVPAAPLATVAGLLACLTAPVLPPIAAALAWLAWLPASWIGGVARTSAALPGSRLPWPEGITGIALYALLGLAVGLIALGARRGRILGWLSVGAVTAGVLGAQAAGQLAALLRPTDWQVAMCDVGQGDAAIVRSAGAVAVVDTGPDPAGLTDCLDLLGIGAVDLLVLTHFDLDHAGGASALKGRVRRVLSGPTDEDGDALLARLASDGALIEFVRRGDTGTLGALDWQVLWPRPGPGLEPGNDASVVVRFIGGTECTIECLSVVLLGDLGESAQRRMLAAGPVGRADVVKVSHHGSADQSEALYRAISAPVALIGVGADNGYGHPTPRLLAMLAGAEIARTDEDGLVLVAGGAGGLRVWRAN